MRNKNQHLRLLYHRHPLPSAEAPISKQQGKRKLGRSEREREERQEEGEKTQTSPSQISPRALFCFPRALPSLRARFL